MKALLFFTVLVGFLLMAVGVSIDDRPTQATVFQDTLTKKVTLKKKVDTLPLTHAQKYQKQQDNIMLQIEKLEKQQKILDSLLKAKKDTSDHK